MKVEFDVDMDFRADFAPLEVFPNAVQASRVNDGELTKHPVGVYLQGMPKDPITGLAAVPYEEAEEVGFIKVDMLHLSLLDSFNDKREIRALIRREPDWSMLTKRDTVERLFQLHRHYDVVSQIKPRSVIELADTIALIRPGKRYLLSAYLKDRDTIRQRALYQKPADGSNYFKKSHSIAYSLNVILQMHLIKAGIL